MSYPKVERERNWERERERDCEDEKMETRRRDNMNAINNGEVRKGNFYWRVRREHDSELGRRAQIEIQWNRKRDSERRIERQRARGTARWLRRESECVRTWGKERGRGRWRGSVREIAGQDERRERRQERSMEKAKIKGKMEGEERSQ